MIINNIMDKTIALDYLTRTKENATANGWIYLLIGIVSIGIGIAIGYGIFNNLSSKSECDEDHNFDIAHVLENSDNTTEINDGIHKLDNYIIIENSDNTTEIKDGIHKLDNYIIIDTASNEFIKNIEEGSSSILKKKVIYIDSDIINFGSLYNISNTPTVHNFNKDSLFYIPKNSKTIVINPNKKLCDNLCPIPPNENGDNCLVEVCENSFTTNCDTDEWESLRGNDDYLQYEESATNCEKMKQCNDEMWMCMDPDTSDLINYKK